VLGCTGAAQFVDASSPAQARTAEPAASSSAEKLDAGKN
jgi:hypothetical protein